MRGKKFSKMASKMVHRCPRLSILAVFSFIVMILLSVSSLAALDVALSDQGTDVKLNPTNTIVD